MLTLHQLSPRKQPPPGQREPGQCLFTDGGDDEHHNLTGDWKPVKIKA